MKIKLVNNELECILVSGEKQYIQNNHRDVLTFVFDNSVSMDELDNLFNESNCETIKLFDDENGENIYNAYTLRVGLSKKDEIVQEATADTDEVRETRIYVSMAQRTYIETKLKELGIL